MPSSTSRPTRRSPRSTAGSSTGACSRSITRRPRSTTARCARPCSKTPASLATAYESRLAHMRWVLGLVVAMLALPTTAFAQGAKPQTKSLDSEAPPGSPPHWLPNETWVMQHWLPYDETRLYSLLGVTRGEIWRWLRDDTRNLAGLAALHKWEAHDLARELVKPWQGKT